MSVSRVRQASWIAFFGSLVVLGLKFWAAHTTQSVALFSDALESVVNVSASLFAMLSLWWALKPADQNHPYGHGKMEYVAATFEGGLIVVAALWIFTESYQAWMEPRQLGSLGFGVALNLFAGALNGALALFLIRSGRRHGSPALSADGLHLATDFLTTLTMIAGIGLMALTGWQWLDPLLGFLLGAFLVVAGGRVLYRSLHSLMDAEDLESLAVFPKLFESRPTWMVDVHSLRLMRSGRFLHVDVHFVVPEFLELKEAYRLLREWEVQEARPEWEYHSRLEPCHRHFCSTCAVSPCPVRAQPLEGVRRLGLEDLRRIDTNLP